MSKKISFLRGNLRNMQKRTSLKAPRCVLTSAKNKRAGASVRILSGEWAGTKNLAGNLSSLPICVIMGLAKSLPPRGRGTAAAVEGACVTLVLR